MIAPLAKMSCTTTVAVFLCVFAHPSSCLSGDKVKLKDVQVLTLQQGQYTAGRRSHPVPQLNCRGGSAGCQDQPSVVQCYNRGTDGQDVQVNFLATGQPILKWECKAEMKRSQKFGLLRVTCEGYDSPRDEYVLVGSCGLEYYLERTTHDGNPSHGTRGQHEHKGHHSQTTPTSALPSLWNAIFAVLALLGACSLCFYCFSLRDGGPTPLGRTSHDRQEFSSTGVGFQPMRTQAAAAGYALPPPPNPYDNPPPYNPHYVSPSQQPAPNSWWAPTTQPRSSSGGPGFWTGAAAGGLLGYLLGNRVTDAGDRHLFAAPVARAFQPASYFANDSSSDGCSVIDVGDMLSDVVSATGFGGTDRR